MNIAPAHPHEFYGPQRPCKLCLRENGGTAYFSEESVDTGTLFLPRDMHLCPLHLASVPSALLEALAEDACLQRRTLVELESARQWTLATGRPVYPRQRVDAIGYLTRKD